jgi:hypothetical protein
MSEMVERMAAAMHADFRRRNPGAVHSWADLAAHADPVCEAFRSEARSAIEAMREPTAAMQRAWQGSKPWDQDALEVWQAMIDAALTEESGAEKAA